MTIDRIERPSLEHEGLRKPTRRIFITTIFTDAERNRRAQHWRQRALEKAQDIARHKRRGGATDEVEAERRI